MKLTYDLLSIFLDKQPLPEQMPRIIKQSEMPLCADIEDAYNLFDLPICRRQVLGTKLLSAVSLDNMLGFVGNLVDCKEIFIVIDYQSISETAVELFIKRILQAILILQNKYFEMIFVLVSNNPKFENVIQMIYERTY